MTATARSQSAPRRIFIFDNPRSRSHLFFRFLATHPDLKTVYHPYINAYVLGPEKLHYQIYKDDSERTKLLKEHWEPICVEDFNFQNAEKDLVNSISAIEKEGKIPLSNEHCCHIVKPHIMLDGILSRQSTVATKIESNPTVLPDELWKSITPILVIRHPALSIPSLYRAMAGLPSLANLDPTEGLNYWFATLKWTRLLFDTLKQQGRTPLIVDGEDVCTRTSQVADNVCRGLGLDPAGISDTWVPLGKILAHPVFTEMTRTIWESDGVKKHEPTGPVNIDDAIASIEKEYGADVANKMRPVIEEEMDNYHFLVQFKV